MSEKCEWNPVDDAASTVPPSEGDCQNEATVSVGHNGEWHLCEGCAALPTFKRLKVRAALPVGKTEKSGG